VDSDLLIRFCRATQTQMTGLHSIVEFLLCVEKHEATFVKKNSGKALEWHIKSAIFPEQSVGGSNSINVIQAFAKISRATFRHWNELRKASCDLPAGKLMILLTGGSA
jgi:hypothetical protein